MHDELRLRDGLNLHIVCDNCTCIILCQEAMSGNLVRLSACPKPEGWV